MFTEEAIWIVKGDHQHAHQLQEATMASIVVVQGTGKTESRAIAGATWSSQSMPCHIVNPTDFEAPRTKAKTNCLETSERVRSYHDRVVGIGVSNTQLQSVDVVPKGGHKRVFHFLVDRGEG